MIGSDINFLDAAFFVTCFGWILLSATDKIDR